MVGNGLLSMEVALALAFMQGEQEVVELLVPAELQVAAGWRAGLVGGTPCCRAVRVCSAKLGPARGVHGRSWTLWAASMGGASSSRRPPRRRLRAAAPR